MASVIELQRDCRRLASFIEEQVSAVTLDGPLLDRAARQMNRLTAAYGPAMSIVRLLVESQGVLLEGQTNSATLPGFLFDMNAFFQALMLRFMSDNLAGLSVRAEQALKGMMRYNPRFNPRKRQSPTPRPDYVVLKQGAVCCLLDAKYRDLWEQSLPPEMLYQLVVYAISQRHQPQSSILYPTMDSHAKEARIDVSDPVYGRNLGQVCLRPVLMPKIETLIGDRGLTARRERERYARQLAFGETN